MSKPSTTQLAGRDVAPTGLVAEWRELLDRHAAVSCALEKELQGKHDIGLSEFETLDRLVDAACGDYRMSDLANDIYLSQSALARGGAAGARRTGFAQYVCRGSARDLRLPDREGSRGSRVGAPDASRGARADLG